MKKIYLVLFLFLCNFCFSIDKFLETCLNIAVERDRRLVAKRQEIEVAKRYVDVNVRNFFPQVVFQQKFTKGKATPAGNPFVPYEYLEEYQAQDLGVRVFQPIYDGGRLAAAHKYHELNLEMIKVDYARLKEELIYRIKQAYYSYLSATLEVKELTELYNTISSYYEKLKNELKAKALSELEFKEGEVYKKKIENFLEKSKKTQEVSLRQLLETANLRSLDEIPHPIPFEEFKEIPSEINYTLEKLEEMLIVNNPDLKKVYIQINMAEQRKRTVLGRSHLRFYLDGFYGKSGEAYVKDPLTLTTVWSLMLRCSWFFGGSSIDASYSQERTAPSEIIDVTQKIESNSVVTQLNLFDDIRFYVEKEDVELFKYSTEAEYDEIKKQLILDLKKVYNDYYYTLLDTKITKEDLELKKWRLEVVKKRNLLYEVPTLDVMASVYNVAEALVAYSKAVIQNHSAVSSIERLVGVPVR